MFTCSIPQRTQVDHDGRTALHAAAETAQTKTIRMLLMREPALTSLLSVYYETPLHSLLISVAKGIVDKHEENTLISAAEVLLDFGVDDRQVCFTPQGLKLKVLGLCKALGLTSAAQSIVRMRRLLVPRRAGTRRRAPLDEQERLRLALEASLKNGSSSDFDNLTSRAALRIQTLARGYIARMRTGDALASMRRERLAREAVHEEELRLAVARLQAVCRAAVMSRRWRRRNRWNPSSWFQRFRLPK